MSGILSSEIKIELARGGQPVVKKDGRWLASSFDPVREALAWARRATVDLEAAEQIFVLGFGSGYHVAELAKLVAMDRFVVVEEDRALAKAVFEICPELREGNTIIEPDWKKLVESDVFRDRIANVTRIARYGPSFQMSPDYFHHVENLILGRDRLSFLMQLKARPGIWSLLDTEKIAKFASGEPGGDCVSIHTLQKLFAQSAHASRERRIWRVLEELVA